MQHKTQTELVLALGQTLAVRHLWPNDTSAPACYNWDFVLDLASTDMALGFMSRDLEDFIADALDNWASIPLRTVATRCILALGAWLFFELDKDYGDDAICSADPSLFQVAGIMLNCLTVGHLSGFSPFVHAQLATCADFILEQYTEVFGPLDV